MLDDMLAGQIGEESRFNQEIDRAISLESKTSWRSDGLS